MNDLIEEWEELAKRYTKQAQGEFDQITAQALLYSAEIYLFFAAELRKKLKEVTK